MLMYTYVCVDSKQNQNKKSHMNRNTKNWDSEPNKIIKKYRKILEDVFEHFEVFCHEIKGINRAWNTFGLIWGWDAYMHPTSASCTSSWTRVSCCTECHFWIPCMHFVKASLASNCVKANLMRPRHSCWRKWSVGMKATSGSLWTMCHLLLSDLPKQRWRGGSRVSCLLAACSVLSNKKNGICCWLSR